MLTLAYHEAGHILAGLVFGFDCESATIEPSPGQSGETVTLMPLEALYVGGPLSPDHILTVERLLVQSLAGYHAAMLSGASEDTIPATVYKEDFCHANESARVLARQPSLSADVVDHFAKGHARAHFLAQTSGEMIRAVALALLDRRTLDRQGIRAAIAGQSLSDVQARFAGYWR